VEIAQSCTFSSAQTDIIGLVVLAWFVLVLRHQQQLVMAAMDRTVCRIVLAPIISIMTDILQEQTQLMIVLLAQTQNV
jgi:hypothetical protein